MSKTITRIDRSIPPAVAGVWGHCGLCAARAIRWASGSTTTAHMWVCPQHADSRFTTEAR